MPSNRDVSHTIREMADLLQRAGESPFRVAAYRRAATTIARHPGELSTLFDAEGERGLRELPGIGKSLAKTIARMLKGGRSRKLERLRERERGRGILETLPGVGKQLAQLVEQSLATDSLEEVFAAACDGRLRRVPGLGAKRLRAIRESLAFRLNAGEPLPFGNPTDEPPIAELLALDEAYRSRAASGRLPLARPRLFNPSGQAILPVWNVRREGRSYTVHFAHSAASHRAGRIHDWVVITCTTKQRFGQWTVITATRGQLRGRRLVMHHEQQCRQHYGQLQTQLSLPLTADEVLRPATGTGAN